LQENFNASSTTRDALLIHIICTRRYAYLGKHNNWKTKKHLNQAKLLAADVGPRTPFNFFPNSSVQHVICVICSVIDTRILFCITYLTQLQSILSNRDDLASSKTI